MKLYDKKEIIPIILILAFFAVGIYFWPQLPAKVPGHWNISGDVDGWVARDFAVWFFPSLTLGLYLLLSFLPLMDPLKKNIESFANWYFGLKVIFVLFFGLLYLMTIFAGLGYQVNIGIFVVLGIAVLFFYIGLMLPKVKRNYMIGIRLPWTLHSDLVWEKTHQFGGRLFIVFAALLVIVAFLKPIYTFCFLLGGIGLLLAILIGYAYREYKALG